MGMDWYAWLSAARLDQEVAYEYALVFSRNELEADDLAYFDHEFLHSMGVSVAKHRLEILKLARRSRRRAALSSRLVAAVDRVARYVRALVVVVVQGREDESSSALVLVPSQQLQPDVDKTPRRSRSKPKSTKEVAAAAAAPTTPKAMRSPVLAIGGRAASTVHAVKDGEKGGEDMVRWDRLFQDLKPN
uniref:SAM domain-containing protein n=1 Tax=Oryza glumipatula TaxID=40148 RepID=A0A0D9ZRJ1_9ORYZ